LRPVLKQIYLDAMFKIGLGNIGNMNQVS